MKKYTIFSLLFIVASVFANTTIEQANEAYSKRNFYKAIQLYKKAIDEKGESAEVYYNLGNAYYRLNQIAYSILNYERSILIEPENKDTHFNLNIVKLKTLDKEFIEPFFLKKWFDNIKNSHNINQWSNIGISCFILFIISLILFFLEKKTILKTVEFYLVIILLLLCMLANIFANIHKQHLIHRNTAIIIVHTATIKSSPDDSDINLFLLHEGSKVIIKDKIGEWNKIETISGDIGWIKSKEIEII